MEKKKRNALVIGCVMILLAAAIAVLAYLNAPKEAAERGTLLIVRGEETLARLTLAQIREMPSVSIEKEIVSASHENDAGLFTGAPLRAILDAVQPGLLEEANQIVARAEDAFVTAYTAKEVRESDSILVVYEKDGAPLGTREEGGTGPLRVLIQDDPFGNRSTKYLSQIEVR